MKKLLPLLLLIFAGCVSEPPPDEPDLFGSCRVNNLDGSLRTCFDYEVEISLDELAGCNNPPTFTSSLLRCPDFNRVARCRLPGFTAHYYPPYTVEQVIAECGSSGNVEVP